MEIFHHPNMGIFHGHRTSTTDDDDDGGCSDVMNI